GGTPSLCTVDEIKKMIDGIKTVFKVADGQEITLEANPDDISAEKLIGWKTAGVNRLSIGIQSFFEEDLVWMNRAHSARQAIDNLQLAITHFENITIDLIYGTPDLTNEKWKKNVDAAIALGIPHISCYALTVEPKTPLDKMIRLRQSTAIDPDKQSEQFLLLMQWLEEAGYEHYEISNFSLPGRRSRHNAAYWAADANGKTKKYLGLGPSAHSYNGTERQWNISNNQSYNSAIQEGTIPLEKEVLTPVQQLNEYLMTSLRTAEGINMEVLKTAFAVGEEQLLAKAEKFIRSGLMSQKNRSLSLTREGKLLADGIAAELFY
ncbi:MAG: radical SAM family heme chaperone HemW, partial [Chitinophagaceae bacterium]|nr:radical SAM family heme chaperone HemW [Chitinophagaceae bacterium]